MPDDDRQLLRSEGHALGRVVNLPPISRCRSCGADCRWGISVNGKSTLVDAFPSDNGNVMFAEDGHSVMVLGPLELQVHDRDARPLHLNHFVTCPDREAWKR